jgi:hypothetical protein
MNKMKIIRMIFVFVLAVLVTGISACEKDTSTAYTDCSHHIVSARGVYESNCSMDVKEGASQVNVELDFNLTSGSINWLLRDPFGVIKLEGRAEPGEPVVEQHLLVKPHPGMWLFEFYLQDTEGEYNTYWLVE